MSTEYSNIVADLLCVSHEFGHCGLVNLGEGNVSARLDESTFLVKASGSSLGTLTEENLTECRFDQLLPLLDSKPVSDTEIEAALLESRVDSSALKPSVETLARLLAMISCFRSQYLRALAALSIPFRGGI